MEITGRIQLHVNIMLAGSLAACVAEHGVAAPLQPLQFFVSWNGVLCIAYTGFPHGLAQLKARIRERCTPLVAESPGSRWPKTSIAAVRPGKRLTPQQLGLLLDVCSSTSHALEGMRLIVDALSYVQYTTRCACRCQGQCHAHG